MPFTIEYLWAGTGQPVERMTSFASQIADVEQSARAGIARVRIMRPDTPPNSYRILDNDGNVVLLRSWAG
jgi:hypothetical protein